MLHIDAFGELADEFLEQVPEALLEELNGGIVIEERPQRRHDDPQGVYILGEYITDEYLGARIVLYYGSFVALYRDDDATIAEELRATLLHEIRHHVEGRAGLGDLELEDLADLEAFREAAEAEQRGQKRKPGRRER